MSGVPKTTTKSPQTTYATLAEAEKDKRDFMSTFGFGAILIILALAIALLITCTLLLWCAKRTREHKRRARSEEKSEKEMQKIMTKPSRRSRLLSGVPLPKSQRKGSKESHSLIQGKLNIQHQICSFVCQIQL